MRGKKHLLLKKVSVIGDKTIGKNTNFSDFGILKQQSLNNLLVALLEALAVQFPMRNVASWGGGGHQLVPHKFWGSELTHFRESDK